MIRTDRKGGGTTVHCNTITCSRSVYASSRAAALALALREEWTIKGDDHWCIECRLAVAS
jgi:hypothetical protein